MGDRDGKVEPVTISTVEGKLAPRFDAHTTELTPLGVTITSKGMASGRPLVDFKFIDPSGKQYAFTTSGRMVLLIAATVQAAIIRSGLEPDHVPALVEAIQRKQITLDQLCDELIAAISPKTDIPFEITRADFSEAVQGVLLDLMKGVRAS